MLTGWSAIAAILVMAVVTFALRALPQQHGREQIVVYMYPEFEPFVFED